jgi:hypothetical protein
MWLISEADFTDAAPKFATLQDRMIDYRADMLDHPTAGCRHSARVAPLK